MAYKLLDAAQVRWRLATVVVTRPLQRAAVFARVTAIAEAVRAVQPGASIEIAVLGTGIESPGAFTNP
jgi:hypothetical protein